MITNLPLIYWDACCQLSYINGQQDRMSHLEGILRASGAEHQVVTSLLSKAEVAFGKMEQDKKALDRGTEEKIRKLWAQGSPIQLVEFYELIADRASELMRRAIERGWKMRPADAIHLATADSLKVKEFQTYDSRLEKFNDITDTHFPICRPIASQPVIVAPDASPEGTKSETETGPKAADENAPADSI